MKKEKIIKYLIEFLLLVCSVAITKWFAVDMLGKNSFFLEMLVFVVARTILESLYQLFKYVCRRIDGKAEKVDYKQQGTDFLFISIIIVVCATFYIIFL